MMMLRRIAHPYRPTRGQGAAVSEILRKPIVKSPLDRADGALGAKRLTILVVVLLVIGLLTIYFVERHIANTDTWEVTVTGVAQGTINFVFDEDSDHEHIALYPEGMVIEEGDTVLVHVDEEEGNRVVEVLED
jgi:hypothetical protein